MAVLQIEHPVRDYDRWKAAFDSDPVGRESGGVRHYEIYRPVDDPNYVEIDLTFDTVPEAMSFKNGLEALWQTPVARAALAGAPRARIVDLAERRTY